MMRLTIPRYRLSRVLSLGAGSLLLQVFSLATSSSGQEAKLVNPSDLPSPLSAPYLIRAGDVLDISVFKIPELGQTRTVGPDGDISLSLVGRIRATGLTAEDLAQKIEERYSKELVAPQVTVSVQSYSTMRVFVGGEVNEPQMLPYTGGLSLVQAIINAGGYTNSASLSSIVLIRKGDDGSALGSVINVKEILRKAQFQKDVLLAPSDIVFVPRKRVADVNRFVAEYIQNNIPIPVVLGFNVFR